MSHWLLDTLQDQLKEAANLSDRFHIHRDLTNNFLDIDFSLIERCAEALEIAVLDLVDSIDKGQEQLTEECRKNAAMSFKLYSVLPKLNNPIEEAERTLRQSLLGVIADKSSDASRYLKENHWPELPLDSDDWNEKTWATIVDIWLLLVRKNGWDDRDLVLERISKLRSSQREFEKDYLENLDINDAKEVALKLVALYHLAKAAEILAIYMTDGVVDGNFQIPQLLDTHFDRVFAICKSSNQIKLEPLSKLLSNAAHQMVENSIWTVTRAVNSRVTFFVKQLVNKGRGNKAIFDVLPPQRRTLAEKGLLGSSRRAVVVSLPTSSGKTLIAQFRILQALNQFDHEKGWVVYLAPTRTLVNQVKRRLRNDFAPLNIVVEHVSPALEVDGIEASMLLENSDGNQFRVLVTTPEKLDLMLRQGWEEQIGRPLTLVVVDEAHNIKDDTRGLKLELLLSTINKECQRAQFLLLTPFINNAKEVARWLGGNNSEDVSLALDWQPNDRVIGIISPEKGPAINKKSFDFNLRMETVHTSRNTISIDEYLEIPKTVKTYNTFSKVNDQGTLTAVASKSLSRRGPVIVMHATPTWVWSLAEKIKLESDKKGTSEQVSIVQSYLRSEYGNNFTLIDLLDYGIGVHHSGLSDEARILMEWLFEEGCLDYLVATTTIAQGVNFPITGVVMASYHYPNNRSMKKMPPEDFWNIAGRAGRVDQGQLGVVSLIASDEARKEELKDFINFQVGELNSALIAMVSQAGDLIDDLRGIVYRYPEWSAFVQYLAHTYRQMGKPENFVDQVEQVLRGTYGFDRLRTTHREFANKLIRGIETYIQYLQEPGQPLKLVDSTGFSLQSIKTVLHAASEQKIDQNSWLSGNIFNPDSNDLDKMMGVILKVPELRENLEAVTGGEGPNGNKLALIVKDWVNGESVPSIAKKYFNGDLTSCGRNLFGKLSQTASWGLGALLSITGKGLSDHEFNSLRNVPSFVYYGVNSDQSVVLRLLGVPREASTRLPKIMENITNRPLGDVRKELINMNERDWNKAFGNESGSMYYKVWKVLEGA